MRKKVRNTLRQFQMVPKGARLVIGLSGGADSVARSTFCIACKRNLHGIPSPRYISTMACAEQRQTRTLVLRKASAPIWGFPVL